MFAADDIVLATCDFDNDEGDESDDIDGEHPSDQQSDRPSLPRVKQEELKRLQTPREPDHITYQSRGSWQLGVTADYAQRAGWILQDGYREIGQNFLDQLDKKATEYREKLSYVEVKLPAKEQEAGRRLIVGRTANYVMGIIDVRRVEVKGEERERTIFANFGAVLSRARLRLGSSGSGAATRGKFGEGLKMAVLSVRHAGGDILIRTNNEKWTFRNDHRTHSVAVSFQKRKELPAGRMLSFVLLCCRCLGRDLLSS